MDQLLPLEAEFCILYEKNICLLFVYLYAISLLMFIYIEVIGLVRSYWESRAVRVIYPLVIAITALARYIILQDKESDPTNLIYLASAILIVSIATVVIRFRRSKYLNIDKDKSNDL